MGKSNIDNPQTKQPWDKTQKGDQHNKITTQKTRKMNNTGPTKNWG